MFRGLKTPARGWQEVAIHEVVKLPKHARDHRPVFPGKLRVTPSEASRIADLGDGRVGPGCSLRSKTQLEGAPVRPAALPQQQLHLLQPDDPGRKHGVRDVKLEGEIRRAKRM